MTVNITRPTPSVKQLPARKFQLTQMVWTTVKLKANEDPERLRGKIIGYEHGNDLRRYRTKYDGWVYHVVLDVNNEIVYVNEEDCELC